MNYTCAKCDPTEPHPDVDFCPKCDKQSARIAELEGALRMFSQGDCRRYPGYECRPHHAAEPQCPTCHARRILAEGGKP